MSCLIAQAYLCIALLKSLYRANEMPVWIPSKWSIQSYSPWELASTREIDMVGLDKFWNCGLIWTCINFIDNYLVFSSWKILVCLQLLNLMFILKSSLGSSAYVLLSRVPFLFLIMWYLAYLAASCVSLILKWLPVAYLFIIYSSYLMVGNPLDWSHGISWNLWYFQDAKKGVLFIDFPPVLQLQLKRFEYDFMRDTMVKVSWYKETMFTSWLFIWNDLGVCLHDSL